MITLLATMAQADQTIPPAYKVYRADRVDLVTVKVTGQGATEIARESLYEIGFASRAHEADVPRATPETYPWLPACRAAARRAETVRWLEFVERDDHLAWREEEHGEWSSLSPDFEATLASVKDALAWRAAGLAGTLDDASLRTAAAGADLRALLAWSALANPQWHEGRSAAGPLPPPPAPPPRGCAGT